MTQEEFMQLSSEEALSNNSKEEAWRAGYLYLLEELYSSCSIGRECRFLQEKCKEFFNITLQA